MTAKSLLREKHDGAFEERVSLRLWLRLLSCTMVIEKSLQQRLKVHFSSTLPRFDVLAALDRNPDGMTMGELSRVLLVSNGNITGLVQLLCRQGFLTLEPLATDRRSSVARLSENGVQHFAEMATTHHQWVEEMLSGLGTEKREALYELLGEVKRSISNAPMKDEK